MYARCVGWQSNVPAADTPLCTTKLYRFSIHRGCEEQLNNLNTRCEAASFVLTESRYWEGLGVHRMYSICGRTSNTSIFSCRLPTEYGQDDVGHRACRNVGIRTRDGTAVDIVEIRVRGRTVKCLQLI